MLAVDLEFQQGAGWLVSEKFDGVRCLYLLRRYALSHSNFFYSPSTGRWISRDPMDELGFRAGSKRVDARGPCRRRGSDRVGLYVAMRNQLIGRRDYLGLQERQDRLSGLRLCPDLSDQGWTLEGGGSSRDGSSGLQYQYCVYGNSGQAGSSRIDGFVKGEETGELLERYYEGGCMEIWVTKIITIAKDCWWCGGGCRKLYLSGVLDTRSLVWRSTDARVVDMSGQSGCVEVPGTQREVRSTKPTMTEASEEECTPYKKDL